MDEFRERYRTVDCNRGKVRLYPVDFRHCITDVSLQNSKSDGSDGLAQESQGKDLRREKHCEALQT